KGADIITFSGDKMLGGPQCGIILGKKEIISAIKANQLARALRVDKLTILALQETLSLYRNEKKAIQQIPTLRMICQSYKSVCRKAKKLLDMIGKVGNGTLSISLCDGFSKVGGGAMPLEEIRSRLLCISPGKFSATGFSGCTNHPDKRVKNCSRGHKNTICKKHHRLKKLAPPPMFYTSTL
ncbi:MAG: hypothetical protein JRF08_05045, partial [Deltaproteobacteria bacterium]|nr:hypothetical protein [Deltaproteobacteria bacterium]